MFILLKINNEVSNINRQSRLFAFRNSRNILVHRRHNTVACRLYRHLQRCCSTQARDNCQLKRAVYTERFNWIKADHRLRNTRRTLRPFRVHSVNRMCTCSNRHRHHLMRQMLPHQRCTKTICPNTALYVNFNLVIKTFLHNDINF